MTHLGRLALAVLLVGSGTSSAAEYRQRYIRPSDGKVLLEVNFQGRVTTQAINQKWDKDKTSGGREFYVCRYCAYDRNDKLINNQLVWYFPNPPQGGNTDMCHYWVYWCNPKTSTIWGRCPTPNHPTYAQWARTKGTDLWQLVPQANREKAREILNPTKAAALMSPDIVGEKQARNQLPKIKPTDDDSNPIACVDFKNAIFATGKP